MPVGGGATAGTASGGSSDEAPAAADSVVVRYKGARQVTSRIDAVKGGTRQRAGGCRHRDHLPAFAMACSAACAHWSACVHSRTTGQY